MLTLLLSTLKSSWPYIAAFFGAVAVGFGMAWQLQGLRLDDLANEFSAYRNQTEQQAIDARRLAMDKENFWRQEVENARINAQAREAKLKKDVAAAQSANRGLRNDLDTLQARLTTSSCATCLDTAAALGDLLGQCGEAYQSMAEVADRHAADVQTLIEAWPR